LILTDGRGPPHIFRGATFDADHPQKRRHNCTPIHTKPMQTPQHRRRQPRPTTVTWAWSASRRCRRNRPAGSGTPQSHPRRALPEGARGRGDREPDGADRGRQRLEERRQSSPSSSPTGRIELARLPRWLQGARPRRRRVRRVRWPCWPAPGDSRVLPEAVRRRFGAPGESRTPTPFRETDFESAASADSATGAGCRRVAARIIVQGAGGPSIARGPDSRESRPRRMHLIGEHDHL
jgi:hypothetical protein